MDARKVLGNKGEHKAVRLLVKKGYQIIGQNIRVGRAEIDILAQIGQTLVFVEVKTRNTDYYGHPESFVTDQKQEIMINAAERYCDENNLENEVRFDVIAVVLTPNKTEILHIEDAFWPMA
jgi:putative endonuclease